jgi:hypothetical protein
MADIVQSWYATMQRNDGTLLATFTPQCRYVQNGVTVTDTVDKATSCQTLFSAACSVRSIARAIARSAPWMRPAAS